MAKVSLLRPNSRAQVSKDHVLFSVLEFDVERQGFIGIHAPHRTNFVEIFQHLHPIHSVCREILGGQFGIAIEEGLAIHQDLVYIFALHLDIPVFIHLKPGKLFQDILELSLSTGGKGICFVGERIALHGHRHFRDYLHQTKFRIILLEAYHLRNFRIPIRNHFFEFQVTHERYP